MERCENPNLGQDSHSVASQLGSHSLETASRMRTSSPATTKSEEITAPGTASQISPRQGAERASMDVSSTFGSHNDTQQSTPLAVADSSGVLPPSTSSGLEGSCAVQPAPLAVAVSSGVLLPNTTSGLDGSCAVPTRLADAICSAALPSSTTSGLEGSCVVQSAPLAVAVSSGVLPPNTTLGLEDSSAVQPAPLAVAVSSGVLPNTTSGSCTQQPAPVAVMVSTCVLPNTTSELEVGHLVPEQGEKPLIKEEKSLDKCKVRKRPRRLLRDARARDVHKSREKQPVIRWKDVWVAQLIHIRGRMHTTFTSPQRQRVDLWQIVKHEMTNSCFGFDKDSEACRKKWIRVYKEYKDDLHLSSSEKAQKCRFYDLVDFYMGDRANGLCSVPVHPDILPIAKELVVPPLVNEVDVKAKDGGTMILHASSNAFVTKNPLISKKPRVAKRPRVNEKPLLIEMPEPAQKPPAAATTRKPHMKTSSNSVHTMLSELVNIGKEMLQTTREFENEKLAVLHSMKDTLGKIAKKI